MKTIILTFSATLFSLASFSQNALVLKDNPYVVINGGTSGTEAVLVINEANPNGIKTSGTGGNIITRGEFDYIKWNVGNGTAGNTYTVPFATGLVSNAGEEKIPLSINFTTAGVGNGHLVLSTWEVSTAGSDNTPFPSAVAHMAGANGQADVSEYVVDRFWIIDVDNPLGVGSAYTTNPTPSISFGYNTSGAEAGSGNVLTVGNLGAQRYSSTDNKWYGWFIGGVPQSIWGTDNGTGLNTGAASVSGVNIAPALWERTWTLADYTEPLPVTLVSFNGDCQEEGIVLAWQTASEANNDYFEILSSTDGEEFSSLGTIQGAGNSNSSINYEFTDNTPSGHDTYYKLIQVDFDGTSTSLPVIKTSPCNNSDNIHAYTSTPGTIVLDYTSLTDEDIEILIYDATGRIIKNHETKIAQKGFNKFTIEYGNVAFGNYMLVVKTNTNTYAEKLILK